MKLKLNDARYAAGVFNDYFGKIDDIAEYNKTIKLERIDAMPFSLPGCGPEEDFFTDWDMHPQDMEFRLDSTDITTFHQYLEITTSAPVEKSIPGKQLNKIIRETNTGKIVGCLLYTSPSPRDRG